MGWWESTPDDPGGWIPGLPDPGDVADWWTSSGYGDAVADAVGDVSDDAARAAETAAIGSAVVTLGTIALLVWGAIELAPYLTSAAGSAIRSRVPR